MIRRPPRSTQSRSSAASDVYKRQVKINSDENQALAGQFGVRGIPNVKAVVDGQVVNEFTGALPESAVREFIDSLLPSPAEPLRLEAQAARCLLYTSPSPRDRTRSRMPSSA